MAIYDNLPVFKETYDLLLQFIRLSNGLQRDFRYTIGERLRNVMMDLCIDIYRANADREKSGFIGTAREKVVEVKIQIRVLHDTRQISTKQYALLMDHTESISKQLASWNKYVKKQRAENEQK